MPEPEHKKTILLIEDEANIRKATQLRLEKAGYSVLTATDGQAGLECAFLQQPQVILLDMMMPLIDGREVLRRLKADDRTKHIPVVLVTVMDSDDGQFDGVFAEAAAHVQKPYHSADLLKKIASVLTQ